MNLLLFKYFTSVMALAGDFVLPGVRNYLRVYSGNFSLRKAQAHGTGLWLE